MQEFCHELPLQIIQNPAQKWYGWLIFPPKCLRVCEPLRILLLLAAQKCSSLLSAVPWSILWFFIRLLQHLCAHALDVCTRKADSHFSCGRHAEVFFSIDFVSGFFLLVHVPREEEWHKTEHIEMYLRSFSIRIVFLFCSTMASSHDARNLPQSAWLCLFVNTSIISSSSNVRRVLRTPPHFCLSKVSATSC